MNPYEEKYLAKRVNEVTQSFLTFWRELERSEMLISYLEVGNKFIESNKEEAKKHLIDIYYSNGQNPEEAKSNFEDNMDRLLNIHYYDSHLSGMVYIQAVDNFITYFKEILSEIVMVKPQILKSQDSERLDFILGYDSMGDLIDAIASKKIEELFYKGIDDIEKFFKSRLGIDIFKSDKQKDSINLLIKMRNLSVHNRRKISKEFTKQFPNPDFKVGEYLLFDFSYVSRINLTLYNFVAELDDEIAKKFQLKMNKIVK